jgi:hypothetical protein
MLLSKKSCTKEHHSQIGRSNVCRFKKKEENKEIKLIIIIGKEPAGDQRPAGLQEGPAEFFCFFAGLSIRRFPTEPALDPTSRLVKHHSLKKHKRTIFPTQFGMETETSIHLTQAMK